MLFFYIAKHKAAAPGGWRGISALFVQGNKPLTISITTKFAFLSAEPKLYLSYVTLAWVEPQQCEYFHQQSVFWIVNYNKQVKN